MFRTRARQIIILGVYAFRLGQQNFIMYWIHRDVIRSDSIENNIFLCVSILSKVLTSNETATWPQWPRHSNWYPYITLASNTSLEHILFMYTQEVTFHLMLMKLPEWNLIANKCDWCRWEFFFRAKFLIENSKSHFDFEYLNIFEGIMMTRGKKKANVTRKRKQKKYASTSVAA